MQNLFRPLLGICLLSLFFSSCSYKRKITAESVRLSSYYSPGMIFQAGEPIVIKGYCKPGGVLVARIGNLVQFAQSDDSGEWSISFPSIDYAGEFDIIIEGKHQQFELTQVTQGNIWLILGDAWENDLLYGYTSNKTSFTGDGSSLSILNFNPANNTWGSWTKTEPIEASGKMKLISSIVSKTDTEKWKIGIINLTHKNASINELLNYNISKQEVDSISALYSRVESEYRTLADSSFKGIDKGVLSSRFDDSDWLETSFPLISARKWYLKDRIAWYRKKVFIPSKYLISDFYMNLGLLRGEYKVYVNETEVADIKGEYNEKVITIPDSLLKIWTNQLTIRAVCGDSLSGIYNSEIYFYNQDSSFYRDIASDWYIRNYYEPKLPSFKAYNKLNSLFDKAALEILPISQVKGIFITSGYNYYRNVDSIQAKKAIGNIDKYINSSERYIVEPGEISRVDSIWNYEHFCKADTLLQSLCKSNNWFLLNPK